jgi:hypothetical protein
MRHRRRRDAHGWRGRISKGCDGHRGGDHVAIGLITAIPIIITGAGGSAQHSGGFTRAPLGRWHPTLMSSTTGMCRNVPFAVGWVLRS